MILITYFLNALTGKQVHVFESGVQFILNILDIIHVLDDFFMIGPSASEKCSNYLSSFLTFCQKVGIPIKAEKNSKTYHLYHLYGS